MRFVPFVIICTALATGATVSPAWAITDGTADGNDHPEVGALIGDKPHPDGTWSYCTGTLISPTVFLTAAHCGSRKQKTAKVTFETRYKPGSTVYTGRYVPDKRFRHSGELHDMAVVVFDKPVPNIKPATLPAEGMLDDLEDKGELKSSTFTPVGYGALGRAKGQRGKRFKYTDTRNQASISFRDLNRRWLKLHPDSDKGDGSSCFGDSGGPNFLGDRTSHVLVATTITGNDNACKATNIDYRLDTPTVRQFLGKFVTLP
ncbi:trypsin-like serine protease [Streptosporangium sp. KLBMP 9127]|nr:trypsin-like serine protease [Streptosporangium sp. KLBMP 9127]